MNLVDACQPTHTSNERRRAVTLTICKLQEINEEMAQKIVIVPPSEKEIWEAKKVPMYEKARSSWNNALTLARNDVTDENFEDIWKGFIKTVMNDVFTLSEFNTENLKRFVDLVFRRFNKGQKKMDISRDLKMQPGVINHQLNHFCDSFAENFMKDEHGIELLQGKIAKFYWAAFDVLDKSDVEKRNERILPVQEFCEVLLNKDINTIDV